MAQLKDSIIQGNLRVSDSTLTDTLQTTTIKAPTTSGGTTYGAGTNGQVLKSNGTSTYWGDDGNSDTWRNVKVNGTEKLGTATSTGAVDFINGTGTTASYTATGKIAYNVTYGTGANTACQGNDSRLSDSRTPTSHTHGNIQNGGTLQTTDVAIASGDKLVVTDSSDSSKVARTSVSFDGSTATKCLTQKGTWESFTNNAGTVTSVTLKANSPISVDSTAAITGSGTRTFSHANSGVSTGTYKSVTVNATGHVTGGSNPTTLSGYGITDAYTKTETDDLIEVLPSLVDESKKNLYKFYYRKTTTNTLEYTLNSDNTITITSGYGSLTCSINNVQAYSSPIPSSQGLVISGCPTGGSENTYHSYLYIDDNNRYVELGDGVLKNVVTGTQYQTMPVTGLITWTLHVMQGNTTYPLTFKPMICSLEDWKVSHAYVPYCQSNYELTQEVGTSGKAIDAIAMDGSKNKLPNNASSTGIFTVNSDGTVTATVPASNTQTSLTLFTADSDISFDHDMVLSGCPADGSYVYKYAIYLLDANGNIVMIGSDGMADEGITRIIPANTAFRSVRILIRASVGAQTLTFKPMLCDKDLYDISPDYIPYAPTNRELYEAHNELDQIKFTPETSAPTSSQRLLFTSPKSNNNLTMLVGKLDSSTNYVQFYVNGVDKGYIKFDVSRNINTWQ